MDARNGSLFSYVDLEARVSPGHPLRVIRLIADAVLAEMSRQGGTLGQLNGSRLSAASPSVL